MRAATNQTGDSTPTDKNIAEALTSLEALLSTEPPTVYAQPLTLATRVFAGGPQDLYAQWAAGSELGLVETDRIVTHCESELELIIAAPQLDGAWQRNDHLEKEIREYERVVLGRR